MAIHETSDESLRTGSQVCAPSLHYNTPNDPKRRVFALGLRRRMATLRSELGSPGKEKNLDPFDTLKLGVLTRDLENTAREKHPAESARQRPLVGHGRHREHSPIHLAATYSLLACEDPDLQEQARRAMFHMLKRKTSRWAVTRN